MMGERVQGAIVVSGGSRGLGLALVRHLLAKGVNVATFARRETADIRELFAAHEGRLLFSELDGQEPDGLEPFVAEVVRRFGRIHGLVNNAAVGQDQLLANLLPEQINTLLEINLRAPILLTRSVVRRMLLDHAGGRIVTVTSICGARGYAGLTIYSATKGALDAFTRSLAREVGSRNILVNAVAPGFFLSEISSVLSPEQVEVIRRRTPTERSVQVEDVLPLMDLLLFGDINLTGQVLVVDGGMSV